MGSGVELGSSTLDQRASGLEDGLLQKRPRLEAFHRWATEATVLFVEQSSAYFLTCQSLDPGGAVKGPFGTHVLALDSSSGIQTIRE